jgi:hypothetical protein
VSAARKVAAETHAATQDRARRATLLAFVLALFAVGLAAVLCWPSRRTVHRELGGDPADAREALRHIADGDLTHKVTSSAAATSLMGELQRTQEGLRDLVPQVRTSTDSIHTASAEIATGNLDLGQRTEQTVSSLQLTAASMEQPTGTVKQAADSARQANQLAMSAAENAQRGGSVVSALDVSRRRGRRARSPFAKCRRALAWCCWEPSVGRWRAGGGAGRLAVPSTYHGVLAVKVCARREPWVVVAHCVIVLEIMVSPAGPPGTGDVDRC